MNKYSILFVIASLCITGCKLHTTKDWIPSGGSRSEALVELSYDYGIFESPIADSEQGLELAQSSCSAWGYLHAEPFGDATSECINENCTRVRVTSRYWCSSIRDFILKLPRKPEIPSRLK